MSRYLFLILAALALFPVPASAGTYAPGSIGFLYEDCQKALEGSRSLPELYNTYCGAFVEGYITAYAIAGNGSTFPEQKNDPCLEDKKNFNQLVSGRFCTNLPFYDEKKVTAAFALQDVTDIVSRWIGFLQKNRKEDPFTLRATDEAGSLLRPGKFCNALSDRTSDMPSLFVTNPALHDLKWGDALKINQSMTFASKYEQCVADIARAGGSSDKFRATRCGAEVDGFIAGLRSTAYLQENRREPAPECKKEINRMYRNLDVVKNTCVSSDTDPLRVAKIFIEQVDRKSIAEKKAIPASIGYEAIYRGFLCVENNG
jgi:hypothetical protein